MVLYQELFVHANDVCRRFRDLLRGESLDGAGGEYDRRSPDRGSGLRHYAQSSVRSHLLYV